MKKEKLVISSLIIFFLASIVLSISQLSANKINSSLKSTKINSIMTNKNSIALMYINGPIMAQATPGTTYQLAPDQFIAQLYEIEKAAQAKGLIIRINSPGGTAGSSQEIYHELLKFKKRTKLPVVISIADIGASGAYWIALAGDTIFANPSSLVGSIGVIINTMDLTSIKKKYGVGMNTYKSVKHKDILSGWRKPTKKEKLIVNTMLDDIHGQFVATLIQNRDIKLNEVKTIADGRIFTGVQAQKLKLIDNLGGLQDAIDYMKDITGIEGDPQIIIKTQNPIWQFLNLIKGQPSSLWSSLYNTLPPQGIPQE